MKIRFSLAFKLFFIGIAYTIPAVLVLYFMVAERQKSIDFAELEKKGNSYLRPLFSALNVAARLRVLAVTPPETIALDPASSIRNLERRLDQDLAELFQVHAKFGLELRVTVDEMKKRNSEGAAPEQIRSQWEDLKRLTGSEGRLQKLSLLINELKNLVNYVGDSSNLILDPDLDSYYIMDTVVSAFPSAIDQLQSLLVRRFQIISKEQPSQQEHIDHDVLLIRLRESFSRIQSSISKATSEDENVYGKNLALQTEVNASTESLMTLLGKILPEMQSSSRSAWDPSFVGSRELDAQSANLLKLCQDVLDQLLAARIEALKLALRESLIWVVACWLLTGILVFILEKSITKAIGAIFDQLKSVNGEIRSSSAKLSSSAQLSASAANQEAAAIQESVAAMAEMTSMLAQTANHTEAASSVADQALTHTANGAEKMRDMASSMGEITAANIRLKDITKIIEDIATRTNVINDIVFKTQLLAVNASVEAARAGHHGKGFAVVANEVGNLAALSGKAAAEIRQLLDESRSQVTAIIANTADSVESGKRVSSAALEAFDGISRAMTNINEKVQQIFDASREQEVGIKQTSRAMGELNAATTSNNVLARDNADLSKHIQQQADRLANIEHTMNYVLFGRVGTSREKKRRLKGVDAILDGVDGFTPPTVPHEEIPATKSPQGKANNYAPSNAESGSRLSKVELAERISRKAGLAFVNPQGAGAKPKMADVTNESAAHGKFAWRANYDIGVEPMNHDHKKLLNLMADLENAYKKGSAAQEQFAIVDELVEYTVRHFKYEEDYLDSICYPEADSHKLIHSALLKRLSDFTTRYKAEGRIEEEFFGFLSAWLTAHIMGVDIKYGAFAQNIKKLA